jgi:flagellar biosynthetic protein FlhB
MAKEGQGGEKTEDATEKKQQDARLEGQVAKSPELMTAAFLLATTLTLAMAGPPLWRFLLDTMGQSLMFAGNESRLGTAAVSVLQGIGWKTLAAMAGVLAASVAISVGVNLAQVGPLLTGKPLMPKFSRLNPISGAGRIFSIRSLVELAKSLGKMGVIGVVVYMTMRRAMPDLEVLPLLEPTALMATVGTYAVALLRNAGLLFLVIALADYGYQRWQRSEDLKMTKQEVKDEYRNAEGDANIKARRRAMARERIRKQMFTDVPSADVVIVNPTHIAIAIKYDPDLAPAPFVIALGQRKIAEKIKAIAFAAGVPVIENKPLARALVKVARVGSMIPVDFYLAVAEVLAFVLRQRQRHGNAWRGTATPDLPGTAVAAV